MSRTEKRVDVLNDLDLVLKSHKQILGYDKILHEKIDQLKALLNFPEKTAAASSNPEAAALLEDVIEHARDLAAQEQRILDESPSACDNRLEEEVQSYFSIVAQLKDFSEKYGFTISEQ